MRKISKQRFDALAGWSRLPGADLFKTEFAWYEAENAEAVAALAVDLDHEYVGFVFVPDSAGRYLFAGMTDTGISDVVSAEESADSLMASCIRSSGVEIDGSAPLDLFTPVVIEEKLNPGYEYLRTAPHSHAARELINHIAPWYETQDKHFVREFQTSGFDARIWELYLFAALREAGYQVDHPNPSPDFLAEGIGFKFFVEATSVNPSQDKVGNVRPSERPKDMTDPNKRNSYMLDYLSIRWAGALDAKVKKKYWEFPEVQGFPLVLAVQDFHDDLSMTYSGHSLYVYLYGVDYETSGTAFGIRQIKEKKIDQHHWKGKTVKSGFFDNLEHRGISAVIANPSGTLSKFNRMGVGAGFGSDEVLIYHEGFRAPGDDASEPVSFADLIVEGNDEMWVDGMAVYHNPNALHPLSPNFLPGALHTFLGDDGLEQLTPKGHPIMSRTVVQGPRVSDAAVWKNRPKPADGDS